MAYTIYKTNGQFLTTIADGTINRGSTSLALPGRNYSGYGLYIDQDLVQMLENFSGNTVPANPIKGQLWYDTSVPGGTLRVCPADDTLNPADWQEIAIGGTGANVSFGNINAENLIANTGNFQDITAGNTIRANVNVFVGNDGNGNGNISLYGGNGHIQAISANITSITATSVNGPGNSLVTSSSPWRFDDLVTFNDVQVSGNLSIGNANSTVIFGANTSLVGITDIANLRIPANSAATRGSLVIGNSNVTIGDGNGTTTLTATGANVVLGTIGPNSTNNIGNLYISGTAIPANILGTSTALDANLNKLILTKTGTGDDSPLQWRYISAYSIANGTSTVSIASGGPVTTTVGSNTFTVNSLGASASGTLGVSGAITGSGSLTITGATTLNGATTVNNTLSAGATTLQATQIDSLGVGTAAGAAGTIQSTGDITAFVSDKRLKNKLGDIENALEKVMSLSTFYFEFTDEAVAMGLEQGKYVGVSAQETQAVMPEIVKPAPVNPDYLTVQYDKFAPLLIAAIKELAEEVRALKSQK